MRFDLISNSRSTSALIAKGRSFAKTGAAGLIIGENGAGRTQFARFIHGCGPRYSEPFVIFDALACEFPEKGLFGEGKTPIIGSETITGGAISSAGRGTLLIKNGESLSVETQIRLSNALQLGGYRPEGSQKVLNAECRFIFVSSGKKRFVPELSGIFIGNTFNVPPLRDRPDDTEALAIYFLNKWAAALNIGERSFTKQALRALKRSKWRGNVAELQLVVLNSLTHFDAKEIDVCHLRLKIGGNWSDYTEKELEETSLEEMIEAKLAQFLQRLGRYDVENLHGAIMDRVERPLIRLILEKSQWNQLKAARILGINRNTLRAKIKKLRIEMMEIDS